jgi:hypothetical protein
MGTQYPLRGVLLHKIPRVHVYIFQGTKSDILKADSADIKFKVFTVIIVAVWDWNGALE